MKLEVKVKEMLDAVEKVEGVCAAKGNMEILSHILINAEKDKVTLTGTNLEIAITTKFMAKVSSPGKLTIPAKKLVEALKKMSKEAEVRVEFNKPSVSLSSENMNFKLPTGNAEDYPAVGLKEYTGKFQVSESVLSQKFKRSMFAVSKDQARVVLTGIMMSLSEGKFMLCGTDGRCLSFTKMDAPWKDIKFRGIIPAEAVLEYVRSAKGSGGNKITIGFNESSIVFELDNITIISRLIEGSYPDCERVVPLEYKDTVEISRAEFLNAVDAVSMASGKDNRLNMLFEAEKLVLNCGDDASCAAAANVPIKYSGAGAKISINAGLLKDALKSNDAERVILSIDDIKPVKMTIPADTSYTCVIVPLRAA